MAATIPGVITLVACLAVTPALLQRLRPLPASRYLHPKALAVPSESGEHDHNLDVADESAPNYLRWVADLITPHLGRSVLEVGAGIGSITARYEEGRKVLASDLSSECVDALKLRFAGIPNVTVAQKDLRAIEDDGETFDSILMVNVLEHIEDDAGVLRQLRRLLRPDGKLVIYVPALNGLYGQWDRKVGHYRRYSKWRLRLVAQEASLEIDELRYVNALAIPAWVAFSGSNVDRTQAAGLSVWDRTGVPISRAIEQRVRMPIGLNLLAVLRSSH